MNPYQPPGDASANPAGIPAETLRAIATYQRYINLAILVNLLCTLALFATPPDLVLVVRIAMVGGSLASAVCAVLLARVMHGLLVAIVCAPLTLIPCVGLLTLLVLNQGATSRLRKAGYKVGLLGVNPADLR